MNRIYIAIALLNAKHCGERSSALTIDVTLLQRTEPEEHTYDINKYDSTLSFNPLMVRFTFNYIFYLWRGY